MTRVRTMLTIARLHVRAGAGWWAALILGWYGLGPIGGGADTEFAVGAAEAVQRWADMVWRELPREIYWWKFTGRESNNIIQVKEDFLAQAGTKMTFTLSRKLTGQGVAGDSILEGQEEAMQYFSDDVTVDQIRNAVRLKGRMSERRTAFNQRMDAKEHLKTWLAEFIDDDIFTQFDASPSVVVFGGTATAVSELTGSMTLTSNQIDKSVAKAKKADPKIWPVRIDGQDWYVLVMHTDSEYDFRRTTTAPGWHETARDANLRGEKNPIFTGALGTWNQTILHSHEKVPIASNYGSGANLAGSSNPFLGMQAGLYAWGQKPEGWEKEFDYGNSVGFAIGAIYDFTKAVFNGTDHAAIVVRVVRTNN